MPTTAPALPTSIPGWWDHFIQDVRYGLRLCRRNPGFSLIVVLTLALGIGLNTAVFSVINAVIMRPLSYPNAERLMWVAPYNGRGRENVVMSPDFVAFRDQATSFERLVGVFTNAEPIDVGDEVVQARVAAVTDGFWNLTGAEFALGGPPPPGLDGVVLPHKFFERYFHSDAAIVGRPVTINQQQTVITGVLPTNFQPQLVPPSSVFVTIGLGEIDVYRANVIRASAGPEVQILNVMGLLKPGVSAERARAELEGIRAHQRSMGPGPGAGPGAGPRAPRPSQLRVVPYADRLVGDARRPLIILQAAVGLVWLVVCLNTANLLLVRGFARQRELAIRTAVGAGRMRILRQFFVESLLLGAVGSVAGLLVAQGVIATMLRLLPFAVPRLSETTIDTRVLFFAIGVCLATTLVFALVPAVAMWKANLYDTLKDEGGRSASSGARSVHLRSALVVLEVAPMRVQLSGPRYDEQQNRRVFLDEMLRRASTAPGVEAAGVGSGGGAMMLLAVEGEPDLPPGQRQRGMLSIASEQYASVLGMRLVKGRWLTDREPLPVFVINETLARQVFRGADPIGRRIRLPFMDANPNVAEIVGVVADLRYSKLDAAAEPELFLDYPHARIGQATLMVKTSTDPTSMSQSLRSLLSSVDRTQPLFDVKPLDVVLAESIAPRRLTMLLLGTFALSALLLVIVGIYGVVAYAVAQRTHEIGIRMALGASRAQVVRMVVRQGMLITLVGLALGVAAALASTQVLTALLYEVTPTDLWTFVGAIATVVGTSLVACCGPAIKSSLIDPLTALRSG
jgi:ABC-type antimicrobial peptide transport system permease subunit